MGQVPLQGQVFTIHGASNFTGPPAVARTENNFKYFKDFDLEIKVRVRS